MYRWLFCWKKPIIVDSWSAHVQGRCFINECWSIKEGACHHCQLTVDYIIEQKRQNVWQIAKVTKDKSNKITKVTEWKVRQMAKMTKGNRLKWGTNTLFEIQLKFESYFYETLPVENCMKWEIFWGTHLHFHVHIQGLSTCIFS